MNERSAGLGQAIPARLYISPEQARHREMLAQQRKTPAVAWVAVVISTLSLVAGIAELFSRH